MEEGFLRERLDRFLKIIPTDYKVADEIKRSPKGFTITIERVAGQPKNLIQKPQKIETKKEQVSSENNVNKSKKKSLDDLLEAGMI